MNFDIESKFAKKSGVVVGRGGGGGMEWGSVAESQLTVRDTGKLS